MQNTDKTTVNQLRFVECIGEEQHQSRSRARTGDRATRSIESKPTNTMTAQDIKSKIRFQTTPIFNGRVILTGTLNLSAVLECDTETFQHHRADQEARIQDMILRCVYEDQRNELAEAIMELMAAAPMDCNAIDAARCRIMKSARFQQPTPNLTSPAKSMIAGQ